MQLAELIEPPDRNPLLRVPGLYRRWELQHLLIPGVDFYFEQETQTATGEPLFALYRRDRAIRTPAGENHS
jgi:hypothetical protein